MAPIINIQEHFCSTSSCSSPTRIFSYLNQIQVQLNLWLRLRNEPS